MKRIDAIEINPVVALDENNQPTSYDKAVAFDVCDADDEDVSAWGVYIHFEGGGVRNVFDVVDEENAVQAKELLEKLYNLK